jgi:hypothetical protein
MPMYYWLYFFFVAFGSKVLLAAVMIYLLFPAETRCTGCDGETLLLRMGPAGRLASRLMLGRLQRRWCPRCGWEGMVRVSPPRAGQAALGASSGTPAA